MLKARAGTIGLAVIAIVSLFFYWAETQQTTKLRDLVDSQQDVISSQQSEIALIEVELSTRNEMLQQQSGTLRELSAQLEEWRLRTGELKVEIKRLEDELGTIEWIGKWAYKPWQSRSELKEWLANNPVSEIDYSEAHDCDDFSYELFWDALIDGRLIGILKEDHHRLNFADVGNIIYEIKPQTDAIKKVGRVD